jgi:hypothetical protein
MNRYELLHDGVLVKSFPSLYRLKEYIKESFSTEDLVRLKLHGYDVREVIEP